jgi:hypothetical protein
MAKSSQTRQHQGDKYQRCAEDGCNNLSLTDAFCVAHREYEDEPVRGRCEDAPCCGCCEGGLL